MFHVLEDAEARYDEALQRSMLNTVWTAGTCHSWYFDDTGRTATLWPTGSWRYRQQTRHFDPEAYTISV